MYAFIFVITLLVSVTALHGKEGYLCVPVADLVAAPFIEQSSKQHIKQAYQSLTLSPEQGTRSCLRVHQAIFNERVTIVDFKNHQVQIVLKNCFSKAMLGAFDESIKVWTYKDWVVTDDELVQMGIDQSVFPLEYNEKTRCDESIISLVYPWYDQVTQATYSAGTRFCLASTQTNDDTYTVLLFNPKQKELITAYIPKQYAQASGHFSSEERRKMFIALLYSWCDAEESIPFVWGGTSFITHGCHEVVLKKWFSSTDELASWDCSSSSKRPLSGLDASGLILRAAQICGISYYCCNSTALAHSLSSLSFSDMREGDIVWAPGYVGIIASLYTNEIIEAQGYARGYGSVHCISLKKRFADIKTWNDFAACCEKKIPLKSLDSQGRVVSHIPTFKLYRLSF